MTEAGTVQHYNYVSHGSMATLIRGTIAGIYLSFLIPILFMHDDSNSHVQAESAETPDVDVSATFGHSAHQLHTPIYLLYSTPLHRCPSFLPLTFACTCRIGGGEVSALRFNHESSG